METIQPQIKSTVNSEMLFDMPKMSNNEILTYTFHIKSNLKQNVRNF